MKIATILPYKENFSPIYPGAVSLFVKDTANISKYKKNHEIVSFLKNKNFSDKIMKDFLMYCNFLEKRIQLPKECEDIYNEVIKALSK